MPKKWIALAVAACAVHAMPQQPEYHEPSRGELRSELAASVRNNVLHIGDSCSAGSPCNVRFGNTVHAIETAAAARPAGKESGLVLVYVNAAGDVTVGSAAPILCTGCKYERGVKQFPPDAVPLYTVALTGGTLDPHTLQDFRAQLSTKNVQGGPGIAITDVEGTARLAVDADLIGMRVLSPPKSSTAKCSTGEYAFDDEFYYVCVARDHWKRIALSSF